MSDVILINTKTAEKESALDIASIPPMNILRIASVLVEKGYKLKIIDQRVEVDWKGKLKKELKKEVVCAGVSSLSGLPIKFGLEASKICKDYGIKTVWGGVHPTLEPYSTIKNKNVDFVVKGEGEYTFYNLVASLEKRSKLNNIKSILFKVDGRIKETSNNRSINLNALPKIPFGLLNLNKYKQKKDNYTNFEGLILPLETSRGCPYNCRFCSKINNGWKAITADRIIDELRYVKDKFTKNIVFIDENFFADHKRVRRLLDLIKKEGIDMNFCGNPRVEYLSKNFNILNKLERCGFSTLLLCIDATSQRMLNILNKKLKISQILSVNKKLDKMNIKINYSMIAGFPYESIEDIKKGFLLAFSLHQQNKNVRGVGISKFMPTPGIEILKDCIKLGFKKPNKLEEWANFYSYKWTSKSPWMKNEVQEYLNKFNHIQGLLNLKMYDFPLSNQIIKLFGTLMMMRIKNDFYKFNFEQKLGKIFDNLTKRDCTQL